MAEREPRIERLGENLERRAGRLAAAETRLANEWRDLREAEQRVERASEQFADIDAREAQLKQLVTELTERGEWLTIAERGLEGRERRAGDLERDVERRQRSFDLRETELARHEQSLNAREQALDAAEADLEQRRSIR